MIVEKINVGVWRFVNGSNHDTVSKTSCFIRSRIGPHFVMASTILLTNTGLPVSVIFFLRLFRAAAIFNFLV